jgi:hypothetical protein
MRGVRAAGEDAVMPPVPLIHPTASDAMHALRHLLEERALVSTLPLGRDPDYVADLEEEIAAVRQEVVLLAVTEIATLRAELGGRGDG